MNSHQPWREGECQLSPAYLNEKAEALQLNEGFSNSATARVIIAQEFDARQAVDAAINKMMGK